MIVYILTRNDGKVVNVYSKKETCIKELSELKLACKNTQWEYFIFWSKLIED